MSIAKIFNFDPESLFIPDRASVYYRIAEYFFTYTIAGEAIIKKAEFIVSGIQVDSESPQGEELGRKIIRKLQLKQKLKKAAIYYFLYGLAAFYPMPKIKKIIICKSCGKAYTLDKLTDNYKPLYRYDKRGYWFKCNNKECKNNNADRLFDLREEEVEDISEFTLAVWNPNNLSCVYNSVIDDKMWMYKPDNLMRIQLGERDHYTICSTPEKYLKAIMNDHRVTINDERLYVMEYPTLDIKGIPIPPMVAAFQDLYQRQLYQKANREIAEDILVPLRMLFPIFKAEGGNRPLTQTVVMNDFTREVRREINTWLNNKKHVPIMPVELGAKNIWGEGRLLVMHDHLRANQQDVLATMGTPLEFIYGGATWSRQNVSAITLENVLKAFSSQMTDPIKYIEERANKRLGKDEKIRISVRVPRLVDGMMDFSAMQYLDQKGAMSERTMAKYIDINIEEERKLIERESAQVRERQIEAAATAAQAQIGAERIVSKFESEKRSIQRREMIKDSLAGRAIEKDQQMFQIYMQEYAYEKQKEAQRSAMKDQITAQKKMLPIQIEQMKAQMALTDDAQQRMAKLQQKMQKKSIKDQMIAQYKAQREIMKRQEADAQKDMIKQVMESMSDEERQAFAVMSPEQQQMMMQSVMQRQQMQEMVEKLPDEVKEEMSQLPEADRMKMMSEYMGHIQEQESMEQAAQEDPNIMKTMMKKKVEDSAKSEDIERMAVQYNKLDPEMRISYGTEIMQEDAAEYAKVKEMADAMATTEYVTSLMNGDTKNNDTIWNDIMNSRPEVLDDVMEQYNAQIAYMQQASAYAHKLYMTRGTHEYDGIIQEIKQGAPYDFKNMILSEYKKIILEHESASGRPDRLEEMKVKEIASKLMLMSPEEQQHTLQVIASEDKDIYNKVRMTMEMQEPMNT